MKERERESERERGREREREGGGGGGGEGGKSGPQLGMWESPMRLPCQLWH